MRPSRPNMRTSAVDIKKLQTSDSLQKVSIFRVQNHFTKKNCFPTDDARRHSDLEISNFEFRISNIIFFQSVSNLWWRFIDEWWQLFEVSVLMTDTNISIRRAASWLVLHKSPTSERIQVKQYILCLQSIPIVRTQPHQADTQQPPTRALRHCEAHWKTSLENICSIIEGMR